MQTLMSPGPLLDDRGHLVETGWAPSEIRKYRRSAITAPKFRIKEWGLLLRSYCGLRHRVDRRRQRVHGPCSESPGSISEHHTRSPKT